MRPYSYTLASIAIVASATAASALAQTYPAKPIRVLVPFVAGSATDTVARNYTVKFNELLGQSGVVDNRPGANGMIGVETSPHTPVQLAERTRAETVKWAKAIKDAGIQPE